MSPNLNLEIDFQTFADTLEIDLNCQNNPYGKEPARKLLKIKVSHTRRIEHRTIQGIASVGMDKKDI